MKFIFTEAGGNKPVRKCDLCLRPMRFLGEHARSWLFRCEDCALVSTHNIHPPQASLERSPRSPRAI